ncbi:MAG: hypothetical protein ACE144_01805 [Thermodesulfobacteriota bacterium]
MGRLKSPMGGWETWRIEECGRCGSCKKRLVRIHREAYDSIIVIVIVIGNGASDRCAARKADFVFAKDSLYDYCVDQDIPCHERFDF